MGRLTDRVLREAKPRSRPYRLTSSGHYGLGRLICKISPSGSKTFYFRYRVHGADRMVRIGPYDPEGKPGYFTLKKAAEEARRLGERLRSTPDLREALRLEKHAEMQRRREALAAVEAAREKSLQSLLEVYVNHLRKQGKNAAGDAAGVFRRHIIQAYPQLAQQPAASIDADTIAQILRRLMERGKSRTAGKLRSYLASAYNLALRASTDPAAPADAMGFRLTANPVAATKAHTGVRARDRVLDAEELKHVLDAIEARRGPVHDALILLLLLGGQRPAQLLRARVADVDLTAATLILRDPKGKRPAPRIHELPLSDSAATIVRRRLLAAQALQSEWLFTSDGRVALRPETLSAATKSISDALLAERKVRSAFQLRDLRRTCETMLAALGISREVRAQLLSHGLSGVQQQHYDRHDYRREKHAALMAWERRLGEIQRGECQPSNVTALPARRGQHPAW